MAFALTGLKCISHVGSIGTGAGSVRKVFSYITNDDAATVQAAGYFNSVASSFAVGDVVIASLDLDGTPLAKMYVVTAASASAVTIALFTTT